MHPSTWSKPQVLLRCITIAVIGFGCASSHLREPAGVMSPQDTEDLVSMLHIGRPCLQYQGAMKFRWADTGNVSSCTVIFLKSDSILKLWSTHQLQSLTHQASAGVATCYQRFLCSFCRSQLAKQNLFIFSAFCMFWPVCLISRMAKSDHAYVSLAFSCASLLNSDLRWGPILLFCRAAQIYT